MQIHSLGLDDFSEDEYSLIGIHTTLEDYKLAYLLNKTLNTSFYKFKENLKSIKKKSLLIAVSGGPDSLALAALSYIYNKEIKNEIFYVHIDHRIRKNSFREAVSIKKFLKKYNIKLTLLSNKNKINNIIPRL